MILFAKHSNSDPDMIELFQPRHKSEDKFLFAVVNGEMFLDFGSGFDEGTILRRMADGETIEFEINERSEMPTIEIEEHIKLHKKLHKALDELLADFIDHTDNLPSKSTITDLVKWSYSQTINPIEK